jgi:serine/threonine protein kinase/tetratricopeptide (TPR) repeat protein
VAEDRRGHDAVTAAPSLDGATPRTIGPFRVVSELGRGGMGVVYRAAPARGGEHVALKMPYAEMADFFGCMRREILALSRLHHPGVVRIRDSGVEKGIPWYAMELLESRSLDQLLGMTDAELARTAPVVPFEPRASAYAQKTFAHEPPRVRSDLPRALTLMYRLARVLAYVHSHGIVHRDLKPQNVLVRSGDRPILVDFGLMGHFRAQSGREVLEVGGLMMGTAMYAAPEQTSGELVDARADLYSFGAMLYEIVTGEPPFTGTSIQEVLMGHLMDDPVPPSQRVRDVPPVLETLILSLLQKRRADRLGYADDVAELLAEAGATADRDFEAATASYLYRPEMVGRHSTLAALTGRIPSVRGGKGAFVLLGGESGIGKTSVATAIAREATIARFRVVTGECDPVGGQPLHPLRPLLREIADYCRTSPAVLERVIGPRIHVLREQDPALAALADEQAPRLAPEIAARRLNSDLADTLAAYAREVPLLLVIDDLQWGDEATLRFLSSLDESYFAGLPLLILGTYRSDETGPDLRALLDRPHVERILLGRLDERDVAEIVRSMLAAPDAPESFLRFLALQSEGNPFFVAEYLRAAVTEQLLRREQGRWRVEAQDQTYRSLGLPGTLRDLVARRLDRLTPLAQRVAEAAAVLGRDMPESLLIAVCGEDDRAVLEAMTELVEHHVFDEMETGVRFAHDKLREGAYARIAPVQRRTLHARAADVVEAACTTEEKLSLHAAELAHHLDEAGLYARAIAWYERAGEAALRIGASREAVDLVNRALALDKAASAPATASQRRLRLSRLHRVLGTAHYGLGDLPASAEHSRKSLAEAGVQLPESPRQWKTRLVGEIARQAVHLALPRRWFRVDPRGDALLLEVASAAHRLMICGYHGGEPRLMLLAGLLAVNAAEKRTDASIAVRAYAGLAAVATVVGLHRLSHRYLEEARALATAKNDVSGLAYTGNSAFAEYVITCQWDRCEQYAAVTLPAAREAGDEQIIEACQHAQGLYEFYAGRLATAERTFAAVRDSAHKRASRQHEAWGHGGRARCLMLMGETEEALEVQRTSIGLLSEEDRVSQMVAKGQLAYAYLYCGRLDEALAAADAAFEWLPRSGFLIWEMFRGLAGPAEVYLEQWRRGREPARMRANLRVLMPKLRALARRAPYLRSVSLRLSGMVAVHEGRGDKLLRQAIDEASRAGLRVEEGIARYELLRHATLSAEERTAQVARARELFEATGCELYLQRL